MALPIVITCTWLNQERTEELAHPDYLCDCRKLRLPCSCTIRLGASILQRQPNGTYAELDQAH